MSQGALEYVPQYFNNVNSTSPTLSVETVTGASIATGSYLGLYWDVTESEAKFRSKTSVGTLHSGRYRVVLVDSAATASNVKTGTIGLMLAAPTGNGGPTGGGVNIVTSYDKGLSVNLRRVVFLNSVTPGNYGIVQELGVANVLGAASFGGSAAVGHIINTVASGLVEDPSSQAPVATTIGVAVTLPAINTIFEVLLNLPVVQG